MPKPSSVSAPLCATASTAAPRSAHRILNINSWNEWTEGSYLEPDTTNGMAYLEAVRDVFARAEAGVAV